MNRSVNEGNSLEKTMPEGIRAELTVDTPSGCPLADLSAETDSEVSDVTWTSTSDGTVTEEFRVDTGDSELPAFEDEDACAVMEVGEERVYQFERERSGDCVCEVVEQLGCPVADVRVESGVVVLTLHVSELEKLREVVDNLRSVADTVEVRYLVHEEAAGDSSSRTSVVDSGQLTDRQREVIQTAFEMGYFNYPRDSTATEVAEELGIDISTFAEHLAAAQSKLFHGLLTP